MKLVIYNTNWKVIGTYFGKCKKDCIKQYYDLIGEDVKSIEEFECKFNNRIEWVNL